MDFRLEFLSDDSDRNDTILKILSNSGEAVYNIDKDGFTLKIESVSSMQKAIMTYQCVHFSDDDFIFWSNLDELSRSDFIFARNRRICLFNIQSKIEQLPNNSIRDKFLNLVQKEIDQICSPKSIEFLPESCAFEQSVFEEFHRRHNQEMKCVPRLLDPFNPDSRGVVAARDIFPKETVFSIPEVELLHPRSGFSDHVFSPVCAFLFAENHTERQLLISSVMSKRSSSALSNNMNLNALIEKATNFEFEPHWSLILYFLFLRGAHYRHALLQKDYTKVKALMGDLTGFPVKSCKCIDCVRLRTEDETLVTCDSDLADKSTLITLMPNSVNSLSTANPEAHESIAQHLLGGSQLITSILNERQSLFNAFKVLFPFVRIIWPEIFACEVVFDWISVLHVKNLIDSRSMEVDIPVIQPSVSCANPACLSQLPEDEMQDHGIEISSKVMKMITQTPRIPIVGYSKLLTKTPNFDEIFKQYASVKMDFSHPSVSPLSIRVCLPVRMSCFCPVADFMNHRGRAPLAIPTYNESTGAIELKTHATIPKGAEVTICYGLMTSWECLANYGFIPEEEEAKRIDTLHLEFKSELNSNEANSCVVSSENDGVLEENLPPSKRRKEISEMTLSDSSNVQHPLEVNVESSEIKSHVLRRCLVPLVSIDMVSSFAPSQAASNSSESEKLECDIAALRATSHAVFSVLEQVEANLSAMREPIAEHEQQRLIHLWVENGWASKVESCIMRQGDVLRDVLSWLGTRLEGLELRMELLNEDDGSSIDTDDNEMENIDSEAHEAS